MLENLTKDQKFIFIALGIVAIVGFTLAIYFGVSCKKCPSGGGNCKPPALVRFSNIGSTGNTWPWSVETWYKYSYVDKTSAKEGAKSMVNSDDKPIKSSTDTNPVIQVTPNPKYDINIYRAKDDGSGKPGDFIFHKVTVEADGSFTDTDNPAPKPPPSGPPTPKSPPVFQKWGGGGGGGGGNCPDKTTHPKCDNDSGACSKSQCSPGMAECLDGAAVGGCNTPDFWEKPTSGCNSYCITPSK